MTRRCLYCKKVKNYEEFYRYKTRNNAICSRCKDCTKKIHKLRNKTESYRITVKKWWIKNRLKRNKQHREWQKSEKGKESWKKYRQNISYKKYRRKYEREYAKREYAKFRDRLLNQEYQAKKRNTSDGTITPEKMEVMLKRQKNKCNTCGVNFLKKKKHLDHIKPISKGGIHSIKNVQWLCYICNISKCDCGNQKFIRGDQIRNGLINMTNLFYAKSIKGEIVFSNKKSISDYLYSVDNNNIIIKIDREKQTRSLNANAFYWFYLRLIENDTGHTSDELHQLFKRIFLPPTFLKVLGHEIKVPSTTKKLSKTEFGEYLDKIAALTSIPLPDPKDIQNLLHLDYPDNDTKIDAF